MTTIVETFVSRLRQALESDPATFGKFDILNVAVVMTPDELSAYANDYDELVKYLLAGCSLIMITLRYRHDSIIDELSEGKDFEAVLEEEVRLEEMREGERDVQDIDISEVTRREKLEIELVSDIERLLFPKVVGAIMKTLGMRIGERIAVSMMLGNVVRNFALLYVFVCPHHAIFSGDNGDVPVYVNGET